jgi:hypothetical protein
MSPANNLQKLTDYLKEKEYSYILKTSKEKAFVYVKTNKFNITLEYNYSIIGPNNIRLISTNYIHNTFDQIIERLQIDMLEGSIHNIEINRSINTAIVAKCELLDTINKEQEKITNPDITFRIVKSKKKAINNDMEGNDEEKETIQENTTK